MSPKCEDTKSLLAEIVTLRQVIEDLKRENEDLKTSLLTIAEHGDTIETQLHETNLKLQTEVVERQRTQTVLQSLLDILYREKHDLEVIIQTIMEHGDILDVQWSQKLRKADLLAASDSLTQIPNRRRFDAHLDHQWALMLREQLPISIILCDVDHFKFFNDYYGHPTGDDCLKQIAQALHSAISRPSDLVARYGGEEFAVILPQTHEDGALNVAERMQDIIAQLQIPHDRSPIHPYITLSMGVACAIPSHERSPTSLLDQADQFLYLAKRGGRNQIVHHSVRE
ncbi:MAG: diguanylate cyclase [Thermosynechococcaceae cyanobacterium]